MSPIKQVTFEFRGEPYKLSFEEADILSDHVTYSADIGEYSGNDAIVSMAGRFPSRQFVFFTDSPIRTPLKNLMTVYVNWSGPDERLIAKYFKVNSAEIFSNNVTRTLWVDSNVELIADDILNEFSSIDIQLFLHDKRSNISDEIREILKTGKESEKYIRKSIYTLAQSSPNLDQLPLYQGRILFRQRTRQVVEFEKSWWGHILSGTYRDQISLPVALEVSGAKIDALDAVTREDSFVIRPHNKYKFKTLDSGLATHLRFLISKLKFTMAILRRRILR